jgi:hypothetical protein
MYSRADQASLNRQGGETGDRVGDRPEVAAMGTAPG